MDFTGVEQQLIFFNETETSFDIEVIIINDGIVELNEYFVAVLTLLDPLLPPSKIMINPALANVTIVDGKNKDEVIAVLKSCSGTAPLGHLFIQDTAPFLCTKLCL